MKKLTRKLMLSIIAVLFALATLGTSTFAWFSTNKVVSASSISVNAADPEAFLKISMDGTNYNVHQNLNLDEDNLHLITPAAIGTIANMVWGEGASNDSNNANSSSNLTVTNLSAVSANNGTLTTGDSAPFTNYVVYQKLWLKNDSVVDSTHPLRVGAQLTAPATNSLDQALRVLVVIESASNANNSGLAGNYALFDSTGAITTAGFKGAVDAEHADKYIYNASGTLVAANSSAELAATMYAGEIIQVTVYVYFDGTDALAKNNTTVSTDDVAVALSFAINDAAFNYNVSPIA